jgi:long-chain acyl-CoA synthetase
MKITRVFDLLDNYKKNYSFKTDALAGKEGGIWVKYSATEYIDMSNWFSYGLLSLGYKKGDSIITITNNRPEWNIIDMGTCQAGMVHIPVYPTLSKDDYNYIFNQSKPKIIIVSDKALYLRIKSIAELCGIEEVYTINSLENIKNWIKIIELGRENASKYKDELESTKCNTSSDDVATMIYTSGTTGFPKGVMLTHNNLVSNFIATSGIHPFGSEAKAFSFLPLSHVYERMLNYHYQYKGLSIYYAENLGTIVDNMKEVQPDIFCSVPRIFEVLYDRIASKGRELPWLQQQVFFWAVRLGTRFDINKPHRPLYNLKLKIANKLVFSKWREALGGNVKLCVSGGAALQLRLAKIFWAAGIPIIEGYGLTETSPVIAANDFTRHQIMLGTVGPVLKGVTVKIADDGEILCKGPNIMKGYYQQPELTQEVIDADGWFHTGDIGCLVDDKFLKITDRKKEMFKLSSGKYICPQVIENKFKESVFIEQAMVFGENQKFASAIVQPNFPYLHNWCTYHKISFHDNFDLINRPKVIERYQIEINNLNKQLGQTEQIKRFKLVSDEWSQQTGELSPTLKLRRRYIFENYKDIIDQIYASQKLID